MKTYVSRVSVCHNIFHHDAVIWCHVAKVQLVSRSGRLVQITWWAAIAPHILLILSLEILSILVAALTLIIELMTQGTYVIENSLLVGFIPVIVIWFWHTSSFYETFCARGKQVVNIQCPKFLVRNKCEIISKQWNSRFQEKL